MAQAQLVHRLPTVEQFRALRQGAGWLMPASEAVADALNGSLFGVCTELEGETIGMGRIVGDGRLVFYVQDLIVHPGHQRQGHGRTMMNALMEYIHAHAAPTAYIGLFSARGVEPFYAQYGFIERPTGSLGPGMAFFKE